MQERAWSSLLALAILASPAPARACGALEFEVRPALPRPTEAPTNAVLLAQVVAPYPGMLDELGLVDVDGGGVEVAIEVDFETDGANETGLLRAHPLTPLAANGHYLWRVGVFELPFTTGAVADEQAPSPGLAAVTPLGPTTAPGCLGNEIPVLGFDIGVSEVDEPVAVYLRGIDGVPLGVAPSWDAPVHIEVPTDTVYEEDLCFQVFIEDPGGHWVHLDDVCLGLVEDPGDTDTGGDTTDTGTDTTGTDTTGTGDDVGADDLDTGGCSCRTADPNEDPRPGLLALLALLVTLAPRRRRQLTQQQARLSPSSRP